MSTEPELDAIFRTSYAAEAERMAEERDRCGACGALDDCECDVDLAELRARVVAVINLYDTAADRVACGDATPGAALFALGGIMGLDHQLRQTAANRLDTSGWSEPVTAEQYIRSLRAASAEPTARLADGSWKDLR